MITCARCFGEVKTFHDRCSGGIMVVIMTFLLIMIVVVIMTLIVIVTGTMTRLAMAIPRLTVLIICPPKGSTK